MGVIIKASGLKFKYPRDIRHRNEPKFSGMPDPAPFNRDDLYEILPVMGAAMDELGTVDGHILHLLEDLLNEMPGFIVTRGEVFNYLVGSAQDRLRP